MSEVAHPTAVDPVVACLRYWQSCSQLEAISLLGQTWFSGFCALALLQEWWKAPAALGTAVSLVALGHLNALFGLGWLGMALTSTPVPGGAPADAIAAAASSRARTIGRSRGLYTLGLLAGIVGALVWGTSAEPRWVPLMVAGAVLLPWFSLAPRWRIEWPLLVAAAGRGA